MPRRPETCVSLCNLMLKLRGIPRSSAILGSDSLQSNNSLNEESKEKSMVVREPGCRGARAEKPNRKNEF